jgi:hypothetical protein
VATASTPIVTDVGFSQLVSRSPLAFPTGTRPDAIAPATVPSANGVSTDESANTRSMARCPRAASSWPRTAYAVPRRMMPSRAMNSGTASVEVIEPKATG